MGSVGQSGKGKRRRQARGELHGERPVVQVGKSGLTDAVVVSVEEALSARELIKVRVGRSCSVDPEDVARALAVALRAEVVGVVGRNVMLVRPRPVEKRRTPKTSVVHKAAPDALTARTRRPPSRPERGS